MYVKRLFSVNELLGEKRKNKPNDLFSSSDEISQKKLSCYWSEFSNPEQDLPSTIVLEKENVEDFYAEIATFFQEYSPLSAYSHVVHRSFAEKVGFPDRFSHLRAEAQEFDQPNLRLWVALALAEATSNSLMHSDGEGGLSFSACRRSLSFCLARTKFLYPNLPPSIVAERWQELRKICRMQTSEELVSSITMIFSALLNESPVDTFNLIDDETRSLLKSLVNGNSAEINFWNFFKNFYKDIGQFSLQFSGSFDDRIFAFENATTVVRNNKKGTLLDSITVAFFANLLLPGSFGHIKLLSRYISEFPACIVWYGFFTALSADFDFNTIHDGIGRKLIRDIRSNFDPLSPPRDDISLDELRVLSRIILRSNNVKPMHQRTIQVAIYPGIDLLSRFFPENGTELAPRISEKEQNAQEIRNQHAIELLRKAQKLLAGGDIEIDFNSASRKKRKTTVSSSKTRKYE